MKVKIETGERFGQVTAPASKSVCHRLLIMAALGNKKTNVDCGEISADISATVSCLEALGAEIIKQGRILSVNPIKGRPKEAVHLYCGESGSTLRFLLPVVGVLGADAVFHMEGRLSKRPVTSLVNQLTRKGMSIETGEKTIFCKGKLRAGSFSLSGEVSSQYISALLMALPLLDGDSVLNVTGSVQSLPYINISMDILKSAGIRIESKGREYAISGNQRPEFPENITAEGDYSAAAFFLCMGALSEKGVTVRNLNENSVQGDREIIEILKRMGADIAAESGSVTVKRSRLSATEIDASQIPDLVPAVAAVAALSQGETKIVNAKRLRFKESDRLSTSYKMLSSLGADIKELPDGLIIKGKPRLKGGSTESFNDHRIAMAAAVAATGCENEVIIENSEAVQKSYPAFWKDFLSLGKGEK